jgi:hypothetical protein
MNQIAFNLFLEMSNQLLMKPLHKRGAQTGLPLSRDSFTISQAVADPFVSGSFQVIFFQSYSLLWTNQLATGDSGKKFS